jgi:hypothetical protein
MRPSSAPPAIVPAEGSPGLRELAHRVDFDTPIRPGEWWNGGAAGRCDRSA